MFGIYLDNNASTRPDPLVVEAVASAMVEFAANAASQHLAGRQASAAVEAARERVAALVGSRPRDVVFLSGATEANNLALRAVFERALVDKSPRRKILVGATEHPSVLEVAAALSSCGAIVEHVPVTSTGELDMAALRALLDPEVLLVSVMAANNETGVLSRVGSVAELAHDVGALVHCDATQSMGRHPVDFRSDSIDLLSLSSHKMHGPKGVGALVVHRRVSLQPQVIGGGHERGLRSGTLNTPGIVGLGVAADLALARMHEVHSIRALRDWFESQILEAIPGARVNGVSAPRLCNTSNIWFPEADAEAVMAGMPSLACSSGSACSSSIPHPSAVLLAMGLSNAAASESLRFSLSRTTTASELEAAVALVKGSVKHVRSTTSAEAR